MKNHYKVVRYNTKGLHLHVQTIKSFKNFESAVRCAENLADKNQHGTLYRVSDVFYEVEYKGNLVWICEDRIVPTVGEVGYW